MKSKGPAPRIYIVAGEASGDSHAALLAAALLRARPGSWIGGVGGRHLKAVGQEQLFDLSRHAVVGLTDVLRNYFKFRGFFRRILNDVAEKRPDVVVLVDFPGFNLRLAAELRRRHPELKLVYYIAPQVWAWKSGRARQMEKVLDRLLVLFPFEKEWFAGRAPGLKVDWVGHPLMDKAAALDKDAKQFPPAEEPLEVALLPGSRRREVAEHLAILLGAAQNISRRRPGARFMILAPDDERAAQIEQMKERAGFGNFPADVKVGYSLTHLGRAHLALVASGTATLECAVAGTPMLIVYKVHPLTFWVGRMLVKLPYLGMVNVLAGEKVVPEFLQGRAQAELLADAAAQIYEHPVRWQRMRQRLAEVVENLGGAGAATRAAKSILEELKTN